MARTHRASPEVVSFSHLASSSPETQIADLAVLAGLTADVVEAAFAAPTTIHGNSCYLLSPTQAERLQFIVLRVLAAAETLRDCVDENDSRLSVVAA